jgi:hypothetical protein
VVPGYVGRTRRNVYAWEITSSANHGVSLQVLIQMTVDRNQQFREAVGRHFVSLSCVQTTPNVPKSILIFSGFITNICDRWFYVTAGHILRDIRTSLNAGGIFDIWRLGDQTAGNQFKDTAIPFDFNIDDWLIIEDEQNGLDYAAIPLREIYCRQLHAGGVEPIGKDAWGDHLMDHDQWILAGIPSESVTYDGKSIIGARFTMIPLDVVDAPELAGSKVQNQFYGRLHTDSQSIVNNIDGMSGGPIFAVNNQELSYVVIGIQSGWYSSNRIIAACPFTSLAFALENLVNSVSTSSEIELPKK